MRFFTTPKFGIRLMAVWAAILALLALVNLLLLSLAVELYSNEYGTQLQVWIIFALNVLFGSGFAAAAYGLWTQQNWGRLLFLWTIGVWTVFNILAVLAPGTIYTSARQYTAADLVINSFRFIITLLIPLLYLNRPNIRSFFAGNPPDSSTT